MDMPPLSNPDRIDKLPIDSNSLGALITRIGWYAAYTALTVIYIWFGGMKFTAYEASSIYGFLSHSPLLSWVYKFMSIMGFSYLIGILEIAIGLLIAARCISPTLSIIGGILSTELLVTTLTFMATAPMVSEPVLGFPAISVIPDQFLLKDIGLLAISILVIGNSLTAMETQRYEN